MRKQYYAYILASKRNGTLYIGSSSELINRVKQHKQNLTDGFTKKYNVHILVYFEETETAYGMVTRERQLKAWKREWKISLIEKNNPIWRDLYYDLLG
jgi:putative endonuclease